MFDYKNSGLGPSLFSTNSPVGRFPDVREPEHGSADTAPSENL